MTEIKRSNYPVCPECGCMHRDAWEWDFGPGLDGNTEHQCDRCEKTFKVSRIVDICYTTRTAEPQDESHEQ